MMSACALAQDQTPTDKLIDHGVAVPLAERRGVVVTQAGNGKNLVIACSLDLSPRGWILVTDIDSGETTQIYCPEGVGNAAPYGSLMASSGKFYTSQGRTLLEFDPTLREWTFHGVPSPAVGAFLRIEEGPDGTVWLGDVYRAGLCSFNPQTKELKDHGRMDEKQQYLSLLAVDDAGWVYCGIGTARCNIVAYDPTTGEKRQIVPEESRKVGTATVYRGEDGKAYGKADLADGTKCYRMLEGKAEVIEAKDMGKQAPSGAIGWGSKQGEFPDGRQLLDYSMEAKWLRVRSPATGETKQIDLDYESEGTYLRVITGGPDGKVWGNSAHPSRGVAYDPQTGALEYYPGAIALKGYGVQGKYVFGGHYGGGRLYVFDTTKPWNMAATAASMREGIQAADLVKLAKSDDGKIDLIDSYPLVLFRADDYGGQIHFDLEAQADGKYYVVIAPYQSSGYCTVQFFLDGKAIGEPFAGNSKDVQAAPYQVFGPMDLKAGQHQVSARTIKAAEGNPWLGIGAIALTQRQPDEVVTQAQLPNPRLVASFAPDVNVPWGACSHADGKHIMISGNPGYGYTGGGIGIYNLETEETTLVTHEQLMPSHCIKAMVPLDNGDIVCGSSTSGGHGSGRVQGEAVLFILDWATKKISFQTVPVSGATEIGLMARGSDGMVYGLAGTTLFVFDPAKKEVVHTAGLSEYGGGSVNGMGRGSDGNIYLTMTKAVVRVKPGSFEVEKIADAPGTITAGIAVIGGRVYFAIGSHLWSCQL